MKLRPLDDSECGAVRRGAIHRQMYHLIKNNTICAIAPFPLPSARWAEIGNRSPDAVFRFVAAFLPPTHRNRRPSKQTANHTQPVAFIFSTEIICLASTYRFKWCIFSAFKKRLNKNKIKFASHLGVHDGGGWATIRME